MKTEQEFNRYSISTRDFEKALEFAQEGQKHLPNNTVYEALLFAAIVSYCRPFSGNRGSPIPPIAGRIAIEDFGPFSKEEEALHKQCKELRNEGLAHSDASLNPTALKESGIISSRPFHLLNQTFDLSAFVALIEKCLDVCHRKRGDYVGNRK